MARRYAVRVQWIVIGGDKTIWREHKIESAEYRAAGFSWNQLSTSNLEMVLNKKSGTEEVIEIIDDDSPTNATRTVAIAHPSEDWIEPEEILTGRK